MIFIFFWHKNSQVAKNHFMPNTILYTYDYDDDYYYSYKNIKIKPRIIEFTGSLGSFCVDGISVDSVCIDNYGISSFVDGISCGIDSVICVSSAFAWHIVI